MLQEKGQEQMELPKDSMMLLSVINTKLRDFYPTLDALWEDMYVDRAAVESQLKQIDYVYNAELNRFV